MAVLKVDTFGPEKDLLKKVKDALTNLTGFGGSGGVYLTAPNKLNANRDSLRPEYKSLWLHCTVEYDAQEAGAEIYGNRKIILGPFMRQFTVMDLEKTILHEFLHGALDDGWQRLSEQAQHGQINLIIRFNLEYPPPPNPANPSED